MSDKTEYNTFVFRGDMNKNDNPFHTQFCGVESVAWSRGNAIEAKDKLEDFIRKLADGDIQDPETSAQELMDEMNWG